MELNYFFPEEFSKESLNLILQWYADQNQVATKKYVEWGSWSKEFDMAYRMGFDEALMVIALSFHLNILVTDGDRGITAYTGSHEEIGQYLKWFKEDAMKSLKGNDNGD